MSGTGERDRVREHWLCSEGKCSVCGPDAHVNELTNKELRERDADLQKARDYGAHWNAIAAQRGARIKMLEAALREGAATISAEHMHVEFGKPCKLCNWVVVARAALARGEATQSA